MKTGDVIVQPVVSEKSFSKSEIGVYMFRVNRSANKFEIKKEVERIFKVTVEKVNTINRKGKKIINWTKGRKMSSRQDFKIAAVTLKSGDTIDIFK